MAHISKIMFIEQQKKHLHTLKDKLEIPKSAADFHAGYEKLRHHIRIHLDFFVDKGKEAE